MQAWAGDPSEVGSFGTDKNQENERAALTALINYVVETTCNSPENPTLDNAEDLRRSLCEVVLTA